MKPPLPPAGGVEALYVTTNKLINKANVKQNAAGLNTKAPSSLQKIMPNAVQTTSGSSLVSRVALARPKVDYAAEKFKVLPLESAVHRAEALSKLTMHNSQLKPNLMPFMDQAVRQVDWQQAVRQHKSPVHRADALLKLVTHNPQLQTVLTPFMEQAISQVKAASPSLVQDISPQPSHSLVNNNGAAMNQPNAKITAKRRSKSDGDLTNQRNTGLTRKPVFTKHNNPWIRLSTSDDNLSTRRLANRHQDINASGDSAINVKTYPWITKQALPSNQAQKLKVVEYAHLAGMHYKQDFDAAGHLNTHPQWQSSLPLLEEISHQIEGTETNGQVLTCPNSGLVACLVVNKAKQQVCLSFGGTTSGSETGGLLKRSQANAGITARQWGANLKNALLKSTPESYTQASILTKNLLAMVNRKPELKDYQVIVTGHSLGGGHAQYSAAMNATLACPITAYCFSSAQLNGEMLTNIVETHQQSGSLQATVSGIHHYKIQGDPVPHMNKVVGFLSNIGTSTSLPPQNIDKTGGNMFIGYHDKYMAHWAKWAYNNNN